LNSLEGIVSCSVNLLTHKALIKFKPRHIGIRTIIEEVEAIGFDAKYEA
jgi:copper chaperone CopZ